MGRVTWESLPFPLPGRPNIVLTRDRDYQAKGAEIVHSWDELVGRGFELAGALNVSEVMLIGGAKLYAQLMRYCDRMYISEVDVMIEGDAHFPAIRADHWKCVEERDVEKAKGDDYGFTFRIYDRRTDKS